MGNGKAVRVDGAGVTTLLNFGNYDLTGSGFNIGVIGDLLVKGKSGSYLDGTVNVNQVCLVNDPTTPCRTTWPAGGGGPDIWVDTTGDTMTGQLTVGVGAGATALRTNGGAIGGYFNGATNVGVYSIATGGGWGGQFVGGGNAGDLGVKGQARGTGGWFEAIPTLQPGEGTGLYARGNVVGARIENYLSAGNYAIIGTSDTGGYFSGTSYGVIGVDQDELSLGSLGAGGIGVYGNGSTYGVFGTAAGYAGIGMLGFQGYGVYSTADIYSSGDKGVVLDARDRPLITRGHDPFTSGIYNGLGRWGLFMEPNYLTLGFPSVSGGLKVSKYNADSTKTDLLTVKETGYVGIGTTNPRGGVEIATSPSWSSFNYGADVVIAGASNPSIAFLDSGGGNPWALVNSAGSMIFSTMPTLGDTVTAPVPRLTITNAGKVGIGTTAPDYGLTVSGAGTSYMNVKDGTRNILMGVDGIGGIISVLTAHDLSFRTSNAVKMFIKDSTGYVGIGTGAAAPTDRLQVFGDIRVGTAGTNGCLKGYGGAALTGVCSSDARLKKDIETLDVNALEVIAGIRPVTFRWNSLVEGSTDDLQLGVIAQDVEKVAPSLVEVDDQGYKRVHIEELPFYLIKAVQELKAENDALKARVEALEAK